MKEYVTCTFHLIEAKPGTYIFNKAAILYLYKEFLDVYFVSLFWIRWKASKLPNYLFVEIKIEILSLFFAYLIRLNEHVS